MYADDMHQQCQYLMQTDTSGLSDVHAEYWAEDVDEMLAMTSLTIVRRVPAPGITVTSLIVVIDDQFGLSEQMSRLVNTAKAVYENDTEATDFVTSLLHAMRIWHASLRRSIQLHTYLEEVLLGNNTLRNETPGT